MELGALLRALRAEAGLRQSDVADKLGVNRSTLANIEAGRHELSQSLRSRVSSEFPEWREALETGSYRPALGGFNSSLEILDLTIAYVFLESRSPSEILQVRKVRALRAGPQYYALGLQRTDEASLTADTQVLWGGHLAEQNTDDDGHLLRVVQFPAPLRAKQVHEFALRSWVERDAEPATEIQLVVTRPTRAAHIHLACLGHPQIAHAWKFGPVEDADPDGVPESAPYARPLSSADPNPVTVTFHDLVPGKTYGLGWRW